MNPWKRKLTSGKLTMLSAESGKTRERTAIYNSKHMCQSTAPSHHPCDEEMKTVSKWQSFPAVITDRTL